MSNDLNKCMFIGRLGKDPAIRYMPSGTAMSTFSIACGSSYKDKQSGQKVDKTEWINIAAFGKLAEIIGEYLKKGSQVYVEGQLCTRKWQDKQGNDRYTTEVIISNMQMLGKKSGESGYPASQESAQAAKPAPAAVVDEDGFDDDITF